MANSPNQTSTLPRRTLTLLLLISPLFLAMTCGKSKEALTKTEDAPAANEKTVAPLAGPGVSAAATTNIEAEDRTYLETLQKQADAGDKDAIKQLCIRIRQEDIMPLNGYRPSDELRASCAEMKIDDYPED